MAKRTLSSCIELKDAEAVKTMEKLHRLAERSTRQEKAVTDAATPMYYFSSARECTVGPSTPTRLTSQQHGRGPSEAVAVFCSVVEAVEAAAGVVVGSGWQSARLMMGGEVAGDGRRVW